MFLLYRAVTWPRVVCPRMRALFLQRKTVWTAVSTKVHIGKVTAQAHWCVQPGFTT